jgi:Taurine catabolism dioxygenase TauD, TfdA family
MALAGISEADAAFVAQREAFLAKASEQYRSAPVSLERFLGSPCLPLEPIVVDELASPGARACHLAGEAVSGSGSGVALLVPVRFDRHDGRLRHPLLALAAALRAGVDLGLPVAHPMEGHPEAVARLGRPDGTLKLYDLPIPEHVDKYREQAETNELFAAHNDGLGYAGLIQHAVLTLDRAALAGGYTYFTNLVALAPALAAADPAAFAALFLPDAITALRARGKGAIRVTSPVFFLGRSGQPQVFFRIASGEYVIEWRDHPALARARDILERVCAPFAPGSRFVQLMRPGDTVVINNRHVVHGRTAFIDPPDGGRVLARKWFVERAEDAVYRHVPGMAVHPRWAELFPQRFCGEAIEGEWHYDATAARNIKIK